MAIPTQEDDDADEENEEASSSLSEGEPEESSSSSSSSTELPPPELLSSSPLLPASSSEDAPSTPRDANTGEAGDTGQMEAAAGKGGEGATAWSCNRRRRSKASCRFCSMRALCASVSIVKPASDSTVGDVVATSTDAMPSQCVASTVELHPALFSFPLPDCCNCRRLAIARFRFRSMCATCSSVSVLAGKGDASRSAATFSCGPVSEVPPTLPEMPILDEEHGVLPSSTHSPGRGRFASRDSARSSDCVQPPASSTRGRNIVFPLPAALRPSFTPSVAPPTWP
mmetsp:Transcript_98652/g.283559  ORF Transcript_98652/g.283559 Transcript_98652/m.283559 type:complete len:284 (+) Transcript_98652:781-1632(+)